MTSLPRRLLPVLAALALVGSGCAALSGQPREKNPFQAVPIGWLDGYSQYVHVHYLVDRSTRTCWLLVMGQSLAPLDCCAARGSSDARERIDWETDGSCAAKAQPAVAAAPAPATRPAAEIAPIAPPAPVEPAAPAPEPGPARSGRTPVLPGPLSAPDANAP